MANDPTPSRPWRDIAQELSIETNNERLVKLSAELNQALDEQEGKTKNPANQNKDDLKKSA